MGTEGTAELRDIGGNPPVPIGENWRLSSDGPATVEDLILLT